MGKKTKRQQPRPQRKRYTSTASKELRTQRELLKVIGKKMMAFLKDKEGLTNIIQEHISCIEGYFRRYDTIQLLGSVGLYLIDNLPNLEKYFMAGIVGKQLELDEEAEVIAEYALNFGLSIPNEDKEDPTDDVIEDLRERLRALYKIYGLIDMPLENNAEQFIDWMIHSEIIAVRGDGYAEHIQEVYREMFMPHSAFYSNKYGFTVEELYSFLVDIEKRIICKLGSQDMITGIYTMHERWKEWDQRTYGELDENMDNLGSRDFSKGLFGDFFEANPDVPHTEDGQFLLISPDDYSESDTIFWVYPQNKAEERILEELSVEFGSNAQFIAEGEYKGNIMNGHSIYEKPFVKDAGRYYCFTPMLPHRNMFLITEKLMMRDPAYYEQNFRNNTSPISRDNYVENKVKRVLESFLPDVSFYSSVHYSVVEDGVAKNPELDILGVSSKATYVIEVKAHELTHKDRVGVKGVKDKFASSVAEACRQCERTAKFVRESERAVFTQNGEIIEVDKSKPLYKISVCFQHYSSLLGQMDLLIETGMLAEEYRDTWIVSLFDLMVCSDFFVSEDEFTSYLDMHKTIYANHSTFNDEIVLLNGFLNEDLAKKVNHMQGKIILGDTADIDEEYSHALSIG